MAEISTPRIPPLDRDDPRLGALLHVPEMAEAVNPMTRYVAEASTLDPSHRRLLKSRTEWLERTDAVGPTDTHDTVSLALIQLADELVINSAVSDATWASLAGDHDVTWMMDAVETVAHVSFLCCLGRSFGADQTGDPRREPPVPPRQPPLTAARIQPVDGDQLAVLRTFARHPVMTEARRPRANFVNRISSLTPHDRETLILRIGWDCQSEYEWAKHVGVVGHARDHGVDPDLVAAGPAAAGVTDHDALLMRVADELHHHSRVSDPTWTALLAQHDLPWMMSAVFTASSYRATSMSLNTYGVQLEPGDEPFPNLG
jgi:4-carboxymuconolactone decarboxylase